jgi:hypothetical protein
VGCRFATSRWDWARGELGALSAHRLVTGHDAFGQGVLGEVPAQARHSVGEFADVYADERALFCPGQLFLTALHAVESLER